MIKSHHEKHRLVVFEKAITGLIADGSEHLCIGFSSETLANTRSRSHSWREFDGLNDWPKAWRRSVRKTVNAPEGSGQKTKSHSDIMRTIQETKSEEGVVLKQTCRRRKSPSVFARGRSRRSYGNRACV